MYVDVLWGQFDSRVLSVYELIKLFGCFDDFEDNDFVICNFIIFNKTFPLL